jgi:O-antigen/teichoic acid export membrane protein
MTSIVYAYGIACAIASAGALLWAWPAIGGLERPGDRLVHSEFWSKLLRFAFFVWATNLLTHLFAIVDRYMLVHCAGLSPAEALEQVGHYHSSRIVPLLMVSVADLLSGFVMPHLSHDWEAGRREHVSARLNLAIKLTSMGMLAFGACVLTAGPFLFNVVLQGRYNDGLAVLPWTMAGCVWYGVYIVAQNYLWCAERTGLTVVPLAIGLTANILLNFVLLPPYGLFGAVLATGLSTCLCLALVLELSRRHGMTVDAGTWLLAIAPAALGFGAAVSVAACVAVAIAALGTTLVLSEHERRELHHFAVGSLAKVAPYFRRSVRAA